MNRILPLLLCIACTTPPSERSPTDASLSIGYAADETIKDIVTADVDGDGLPDLLVLSVSPDGAQAHLFLGSQLIEAAVVVPDDAHAVFRGNITGISNAGDLDGDGRDALALGNVQFWGLFPPDSLVEGGVLAPAEPPVLISGNRRMLAVVGGDITGDGIDDLIATAVQEGYDCGFWCGWWRPRELGYVLPGNLVPDFGRINLDSEQGAGSLMRPLYMDILDEPGSDYTLELVGDIDGDGTGDVASGGRRNWVGAALRKQPTGSDREVASLQVWLSDCFTDSPGMDCTTVTRVQPAGDVDGDGQADILTWLRGNFATHLVTGARLTSGPTGVRFGGEVQDETQLAVQGGIGVNDLDLDGFDDLLLVPHEVGAVQMFGGGTNVFDLPLHTVFRGFGDSLLDVHPVGDLDGDGLMDAALVADHGTWISIVPGAAMLPDVE